MKGIGIFNMNDREQYKIMIKNDLDFVIDKIIEKNNDLTRKELKIEELENINDKISSALNSAEKEIDRLNNKLMAVRKYLKDNEREYGSLEDNEKIILGIIDGDE